MKKALLFSFCIVLLFQGCSTRKAHSNYKKPSSKPTQKQTTSHIHSKTLPSLYQFYNAWKGTPYAYGGTSKKGTDCSGFVMQGYRNVYGLKIARSTAQQVKQGHYVNKSALKTGDLIFFKTGWNTRHVGIYLEKGNFMHASTKRGVTIGSIHNPYWRQAYWQARRLR